MRVKQRTLSIVALLVSSMTLITVFYLPSTELYKRTHTLGMENTIEPLLNKVMLLACYPEGANYQERGDAATLIYKRESNKSCISGIGNYLYARCYSAKWRGNALYYMPFKDVSLGSESASCIDEEEVDIPYYDERLAAAELGKEYLVVDHSE